MIQKWRVLTAVACGTFMATLDSSIVNIALPTLTKAFNTQLFQVKWVVIVYLLVVTSLLLPFGRLSDLKGRKIIFQLGFLVFTLGSALCGLSPSLGWLIFFRAVQASGASMLMANGPAIITTAFSSRERGTALGTLAMVVSLGLISGPSVGGLLITHYDWRSIFWINVPVGLAGIVLAQLFIPKHSPVKKGQALDWMGILIQSVVLTLVMILLEPQDISAPDGFLVPAPRWLISIILLLLVIVFAKVESQAEEPILDFSLFRNRTFLAANIAAFSSLVAFSAVSVLMPFFFEEVLHYPAQKTGLFMTAIPLTVFVVAPISGRLSDRLGSRKLSLAGTAVGAIVLFAMAGWFGLGVHEQMGPFAIVLALCSVGLAMGLFQSPNNSAMMSSVPPSKLGVASALLATIRNLGLVMGTGLATSLFSWRIHETGNYTLAIHTPLAIGGVAAVIAMGASLSRRR